MIWMLLPFKLQSVAQHSGDCMFLSLILKLSSGAFLPVLMLKKLCFDAFSINRSPFMGQQIFRQQTYFSRMAVLILKCINIGY